MARKAKPATPTSVEALRHQDKRVNIPTDELRDFVTEAEEAPTTLLYPRDPSLDPQLVWKGKDDQDDEDLAIPVVPVYIQEKIEPRVLVENLRVRSLVAPSEAEPTLFEGFNGLEFEELIDFYRHPVNWSNRLILGDSLLVMASLASKENLKGSVQMIYIDPPYGIRFGSNWQISTRKRDVRDGRAEDVTRQPEQIRAFRDTWELGVHSYLSYLRDRFTVARDLLTESGSIFVQIGDDNVHLVRGVLDEVFGSENFIAQISFRVKSALATDFLGRQTDFLLWYARDREACKWRRLYTPQKADEQPEFNQVELADGERCSIAAARRKKADLSEAKYFTAQNLASSGYTASCTFTYEFDGRKYSPPGGHSWKTTRDGMDRLASAGRLVPLPGSLRYAYFFEDFPYQVLTDVWMDTFGEQDKSFVVQTQPDVIQRCILMTTDPGDLVLDPTCGSGTTAYVAEQWGRRWITIDTSRVALTLARTRLMAANFSYYLLADSIEGADREAAASGLRSSASNFAKDIRKGFVYKRVAHVTLKSIAQNPEIRSSLSRQETASAIAQHADTELLVDQPYEDRRRVRVSGPFTVESLSPHRVLDDDHETPASEQMETQAGTFVEVILDNMAKAGVQNTKRGERLTFDWLQPFAGEWISAHGEFTDADGEVKRVAVSIGPEHGTVGPLQVKEAAKEAVRGRGFDILVICGFAFDARVGEAAREFGNLIVLPARMNPDLAMGDELLKKTGAGNLFTVFGEPDLTLKQENGRVVIELHGVDVYDPTTGEVRSNSTDDVACWFIDTDYNEESFFVRHAYFTGSVDPYDRLRRALRADIDEEAWSTLYSTVSRPFDTPSTGKVAVKVINHYGDEVMHVYEVTAG